MPAKHKQASVRKPRSDAQRNRERLLEVARQAFSRSGANTSLDDIAKEAGVEDVGAGMSVSWLDYDNDGRQDLYVADMWTAAGLRVAMQEKFQPNASADVRGLYRRHGNGFY